MSTELKPETNQAVARRARRDQARRVAQQQAAAQRRRAKLRRWGLLTAAVLVLAAGAYLVLRTSGASGSRPYVGGDLHSLVVDPANPERVLVGGHDGGAISLDGGQTWQAVSGLRGADPMGWSVDPSDPLKMYVAGHPGFFRSEDGGQNWSKGSSGLPGTDLHGLGLDAANPSTLYVYVTGRGIYHSPDAGRSWELVNADQAIMGPILVDPRQPGTLYLADVRSGFQRSADGGKSWEQLGTIPGGMAMWIAQDQQAPDTFYAASGTVLKSADGGRSWRPSASGLAGSVSAVAVAPANSRIVYAGVLEGSGARVFRSDDGGTTWSPRN